ncbi:MAG: alanyl-tRNA editing protein [Clostridia bacterium]|nr:alanyl-tRNA editing protein [Clostridia bacterium]
MTEKLYYQDPYLFTFTATVLSCTPQGDNYAVELDRTAFFPEEGGQYADTGLLAGISVLDVKEKEGGILHTLPSPLPVGAEVVGQIEEKQRLRKMQNHTGEHIVSGLFHSLYGLSNVGFHLGHDDLTIDLDGTLTRADLERVEYLANEAVWKNLPIRAEFPSSEALATLDYRSKLDLTENVRIVTIPGYDVCACCAPHVAYTGEVGQIKLLDFARYKGGVRIHMLCGMDALEDYHARYVATAAISAKLTAPQSEVAEAVDRLHAELQEKKQQIARLQLALADELLHALPDGDAPALFFEDRLDAPARRALVNGAAEKRPIAALFSGDDRSGYTFLMGSNTIDLRPFVKTMTSTLAGKGGGSATMVQGTLTASRKDIEEYFNK